MENKIEKIKCSYKEHFEIDASTFCNECKVYMCNKCDSFHSKLLQNHHSVRLNKKDEEIFTGLCKEEKHQLELEFFCKTHNVLCCAACISKIKNKDFGKHKDCDVCVIEDIKEEKKKNLKFHMKNLQELSYTLQDSVNHLKLILEKTNQNKEELQLKIQQFFTNVKTILNKREDELLFQIEKQFKDLSFNEELIKDSEKLNRKIKLSLEKGKKINEEYNNIKLNYLINDCINFENNFKDLNIINEIVKKSNSSINSKIVFEPNEKDITEFIDNIKTFGKFEKYYLLNSTILNNEADKQISLINWIKEKTEKEFIKFDLLYKMSENGSSWEDFHKYCDNKGPTLLLIHTTENKIFGGFTPLNWKKIEKNEIYDESNQTFIFSLNLMKKYDMINHIENKAIRYLKNYGPIFGDKDIALCEDMKKGVSFANELCNFLSDQNLELTGGKGAYENFETDEIEIFRVIY